MRIPNNSDSFLQAVKYFLENDLHLDTPVKMLVWTTTPWTLPSNLALAVNEDIEYCAFICDDSLKEPKPSIFIASKSYFDKQAENHWFLGGFKLPMVDILDDKENKTGRAVAGDFSTSIKLKILNNYFPLMTEHNNTNS